MKTLSKSILITFALFILSACSKDGTAAPRAAIGAAGAPILIEEFSDFECPACAVVSPEMEAIARANTDKVRLEFNQFPLPQHKNAFRAAVASECANLQGKFWEYSKLLFENQKNLTDDKFKEIAQTVSLDTTAFNQCLEDNQTAGRVRDDLQAGKDRGVSYTPSFYVNGKLVQFTSREKFEGYINSLK